MKAIPKIQKYMTTAPFSIAFEATLEDAMNVMEKHHIRHLPVVKSGRPFGIISDRDLKAILAFGGTNPKQIKVGEVCSDEPYTTKPDALLNEVAANMAEQKLGSALVIDNGRLVGIFTATDACQALSEICSERFHT